MFKRTGLLIIILLANPFMNMASADDFSNVVGYKDALKGDGFPPPISEIINAIGKTDKLRIAINSKNQIKSYIPDNTEKINDEVSIITVNTDEFQEFFLWNDNFMVSYCLANNSIYRAKLFIYYDPKLSIIEQEKVLMEKTKDYLESLGFKDNSSWFSRKRIEEYSKGNIVVKYGNSTLKTVQGLSIKSLLITIDHPKLSEDANKLADAIIQLQDLKIKNDLKPLDKIFK